MKLDAKQIVEIIGLSALILSVLFLGYELRQSNQLARTSARFEISNNYAALNESIYTNHEFAILYSKLKDPSFIPNDVEAEKLTAYLTRINNVWVAVETAYQNGHYDENNYQGTLDDVRATVRFWPGLRPFMRNFLENYPNFANREVWQVAGVALEELN